MKPIVIFNNKDHLFSEWSSVVAPIGIPVAQTRTGQSHVLGDHGVSMGLWECSRGVWRRQVLAREYSYIVAGHCFFTPDGQEPIELRAGDSVFFPANCSGIWDIREDLLKSYLILD